MTTIGHVPALGPHLGSPTNCSLVWSMWEEFSVGLKTQQAGRCSQELLAYHVTSRLSVSPPPGVDICSPGLRPLDGALERAGGQAPSRGRPESLVSLGHSERTLHFSHGGALSPPAM